MRALIVAACVVTMLAGCSAAPPPPAPTPSSPAPTGDGVLTIGTLLPTTGNSAFIGPAQVAGVSLAVSDINAAGGVNGVPVVAMQRDSGDAASGTMEASFADLVAQGADVVVGPSSSVLAQRLIPLAVKARIPVISPAATFPGLTTIADAGYFFRTVPAYGEQGYALGKVLSEGGPTKVGFVYFGDEFGAALAPALEQGVTRNGSMLVVSEAIPVGGDVAPAIGALVAAAPDVVVVGSTYSSIDATKALITAVIAAGFDGGKLWLTTQNTGDYSQALPGGTLTGVNGIIEGAHPDDAFIARLKGVNTNLVAFQYGAEAYDATILAALAATVAPGDGALAGTLVDVSRGGIKCTTYAECLEVLKTQSDIDYDGLSGPLSFAPDGDISPAFYGLYAYDAENRFSYKRGIVAG